MNMKRIISGILVAVMIFSLVASLVGCADVKKPVAEQTEPIIEETFEPEADATEETEAETEAEIEEPEQITEDVLKEAVSAELDKSIFIKEALINIAESEILPFDCVVEDVPEDFMPGFINKVNGYHEAAMMLPVISSQPFIVYLFHAEDVDALKTDLMKEADPRWNICTEASVVVCEEYGEIVLFAMLP